MTSAQLKRFLSREGCIFEPAKGGHLWVRRGNLKTIIPVHGSNKELGTGLVNKILKDLGLK